MFDIIGGAVCHQLPQRTLAFDGRLLPVCARCTGIYVGIFLSVVFLVFARRTNGGKPFGLFAALLIAAAMTPMVLDGASTYAGLRETTNLIRILTGAAFGAFIPVLYILAIRFDIHSEGRVIAHGWELAMLFGAAVLLAAALYKRLIGGWFSVSVIVCGTIVLSYAAIAYMCVKRLAELWNGGKHGKYNRDRQEGQTGQDADGHPEHGR